MRMQFKLTVGFLLVGVLSAGAVGSIAHMMVMRDFQIEARKLAFERFTHDFSSFVRVEPDWKKAFSQHTFTRFVLDRRKNRGEGPLDLGHEPLVAREKTPPFRFLVLDPAGVVVIGTEGYEPGLAVPAAVMEGAVPIQVDGEVIAFVSLIGDVALTPQDQRYLEAVTDSLVTGVSVSIGLSLLFGVIFGSGMSRSLKRLTWAARKMYTSLGERQKIPVVGNDEIAHLTIAFNDMSQELAKAHDDLREMGVRDVLTGLHNRRYFDEQARQAFEQAVRYEQPMTVMIGDLDHFKRVNDDFSHDMGDRVLRQVGELLAKTTRKSDVVARYGGEEFVILFPNTDAGRAALSCEKIRAAIEAFPWGDFDPALKVTMSMGVCDDTSLENVEKMLSRADGLLYLAKKQGRNRVVTHAD